MSIAEFFVHIVGTATGVVAKPHAEVFDLVRLFLEDLVDDDDFTISTFNLLQLRQKIPVARSCYDGVGSEDFHTVDLWLLRLLLFQLAFKLQLKIYLNLLRLSAPNYFVMMISHL